MLMFVTLTLPQFETENEFGILGSHTLNIYNRVGRERERAEMRVNNVLSLFVHSADAVWSVIIFLVKKEWYICPDNPNKYFPPLNGALS